MATAAAGLAESFGKVLSPSEEAVEEDTSLILQLLAMHDGKSFSTTNILPPACKWESRKCQRSGERVRAIQLTQLVTSGIPAS